MHDMETSSLWWHEWVPQPRCVQKPMSDSEPTQRTSSSQIFPRPELYSWPMYRPTRLQQHSLHEHFIQKQQQIRIHKSHTIQSHLLRCSTVINFYRSLNRVSSSNNNNNNNTLDNICCTVIMTQVIARVHPVPLMNVNSAKRQPTLRPSQPTVELWVPCLRCYPLHPSSPIVIAQPESWYSFYRPYLFCTRWLIL